MFDDGGLVAESLRFGKGEKVLTADIDVERLVTERMKLNTWGDTVDSNRALIGSYRQVGFVLDAPKGDIGFKRTLERFPFVPSDAVRLDEDCYEAYNIQVQGLVTRLAATGVKKVILGVSGGLDSTHALIVCAKAMDRLGLPRSNVLAYTMPGFGTSTGTRSNAWKLMEAFGATAAEISINDVATQTLKDIGHPAGTGAAQYDITYENVQAGARTATLFRLANLHNGIVIGTGDLSELALGWCTYGVGDHMSHYGVNAGVPKTMIQYLIRWVIARDLFGATASAVLQSILDTEISPELIPATAGQAIQRTEDTIGPYELQDFNIFWTVRHALAPSKVAFLAWHTWRDIDAGRWPDGLTGSRRHAYTLAEIRKWLEVFLFRFFTTSQFKRSAVPNAPKVLSGASLSPRGDWRAPSDGNARIWIEELKANVPER
ncbi:MAG: NAD(+) synthase [Micropepsaceae bacterium]